MVQRGLLTLPKEVCQDHNIQPGQQLTLLDLDGVFVLSPQPLQVADLADQIAGELSQRGETLESMLAALREVRAEHG